jgi:hypothetical protein
MTTLEPLIPAGSYGAPQRIKLLATGLNVAPLAEALAANPHVWNVHTGRTAPPDSPHHGLDDVWCRFASPGVSGADPHIAQWYPEAECLGVRSMAREIMAAVGGEVLGGVLITRIPPGATCKPHVDPGWHAGFYDKFAVQVAAAPGQAFHFEGEALASNTGDLYWFDNSHSHWVTNDSDEARITAIFCIRVAREGQP